ncbi:MAG TPA: YqaE/Pmp3 family membrane protein [Roseiarcus sp.]|nr:YqaE/Pmp3 family membrane protein [Roseiarcus sp.]
MRYLIALFLPWLAFFTMGMPISGVVCLILQLTLIGWLPATIWAFFAINNHYAEQRDNALRRELGRS